MARNDPSKTGIWMAEDSIYGAGLVTRRNIAQRLLAVRRHRGQRAADALLSGYRHRVTHIKKQRSPGWQARSKQSIASTTAYKEKKARLAVVKNWRAYGEPIATGGVSFETQHPRWPKNAPHGKGGKWRPKRGG